MRWYRGCYGSWNDKCGVRYIPGTFSRKEIKQVAQEIADRENTVVTIIGESNYATPIEVIKICPSR